MALFTKDHIPWNKGTHKTTNTGRTWFQKGHGKIALPDKEIIDLYQSGLSQRKVGEAYGVCQHVIRRLLDKNGIRIKTKSEQVTGSGNHQFTDGHSPTFYAKRAYRIYPKICLFCGNTRGKIVVHHKDLNPRNNPEDGSNWMILCHKCHIKLHYSFRP